MHLLKKIEQSLYRATAKNKKLFASNYSDSCAESHHQLTAVPIVRNERTIETLT